MAMFMTDCARVFKRQVCTNTKSQYESHLFQKIIATATSQPLVQITPIRISGSLQLSCHYPDSHSLSSLSPALASVSPTFPSPFSTAKKIYIILQLSIIKLSLREKFSLTEAKPNVTRLIHLFFPLLYHLPALYQLEAENNQWKNCR